jgi:hypothetical protein
MIFFITVITFIAIMFFYKCFYSVSNGIDSQVMRSFRQQQLAIAIVNYAKLRDTTCDKICYRRELNFLRTRITLTNSVSNRLVSNGHFYYSYKICREYYVNVLRANFGSGTPRYLQPYVFKQNLNVDFLSCYLKLRAMADLDYALY